MVREYTRDDYKEVSGWFHKRSIPITEDYLPKHGFIVPGIAAGFIFSTDSNFCIFECFVSNPNTTRSVRKEALSEIVTSMIQKAKELNFKEAYGFATSKTMIQIGEEQGFKFIEKCDSIVRQL